MGLSNPLICFEDEPKSYWFRMTWGCIYKWIPFTITFTMHVNADYKSFCHRLWWRTFSRSFSVIVTLFTWRVCCQGLCLWIPSPPACSGGIAHSGECESALAGPPCWPWSAFLSASRNHSDSHSPLENTKHMMSNGKLPPMTATVILAHEKRRE